MATLIPKYDQGATGAANRPFNLKLEENVSVKDFGAVGNGITDDTAAFQAAITYLASTITVPEGAALYVPDGNYVISSTITIPPELERLNIYGQGKYASQISASAGITIFTANVRFTSCVIQDIRFNNGAKVFNILTANVDQSMLTFQRCFFYLQTDTSVVISNGSNSTLSLFENCLWQGSQICVENWGDYCYIKDCWVSASGALAFQNKQGEFVIEGLVGVGGVNPTDCIWVAHSGNALKLLRSRFVCDGGGNRTTAVVSGTALTASLILVEDCFIGNNSDAPPNFIFSEAGSVPEFKIFKNNRYYTSSGLIETVVNATGFPRGSFINENGFVGFYQNGTNLASNLIFEVDDDSSKVLRENPLCADVLLHRNATFLGANAPVGATVSTGTYPYFNGLTVRKITGTSNNGSLYTYQNDPSWLATLTNLEQYTFVNDFYLQGSGAVCTVVVTAFGYQSTYQLTPGLNVINMPFVFNTGATGNQFISVEFRSIASGQEILHGRTRVLRGRYKVATPETVIKDASATSPPSSTYIVFNTGDNFSYTNPASGDYFGQVYSTTGWKTYGAIS